MAARDTVQPPFGIRYQAHDAVVVRARCYVDRRSERLGPMVEGTDDDMPAAVGELGVPDIRNISEPDNATCPEAFDAQVFALVDQKPLPKSRLRDPLGCLDSAQQDEPNEQRCPESS